MIALADSVLADSLASERRNHLSTDSKTARSKKAPSPPLITTLHLNIILIVIAIVIVIVFVFVIVIVFVNVFFITFVNRQLINFPGFDVIGAKNAGARANDQREHAKALCCDNNNDDDDDL